MSANPCDICSPKKKCSQQNHILHEDKLRILKELQNNLAIEEENMSSTDNTGLSPTSSRANISVSQISLPLAWKPKENGTYSMFVVIQSKTRVIETQIISNVNRNMTDVIIPQHFYFESEPEDFVIEILIFTVRTDFGLETNTGGSLKERLTRSIGRKFGSSVKNQIQESPKKSSRFEQTVGGNHFNFFAKTTLCITDACEDATIYNLETSTFAALCGPPLYGQIICRLSIQPLSVLRPIAEGVLSIHHLEEDIKYDNIFTRLQTGKLSFFTIGDISHSSMNTIHVIPLNRRSRILTTDVPLTMLLKTDEAGNVPESTVYLRADNERAFQVWRRAIELQIYDIGIWGMFASRISPLLSQRREDPIRETMSRNTGINLYETISVRGSVSKAAFGALSLVPCEGNNLPPSATAPVKRHKQRANVIDLFQSPKAERKEQDPSKYVIQLKIGDEPVENEYSAYSPLYKLSPRPGARANHRTEEARDGRKSWSKSIGSFIHRNSSQTTRL